MQEKRDDIYEVNGCRLDIRRGVIERDGRHLRIRPKTFAMLSYLARNPDRVVAKDELIEAIWGKLTVTDDALTQTVKDIRRVIDDKAANVVRTVPRRGYLLERTTSFDGAGWYAGRPLRHAFEILVEESKSAVPLADGWEGPKTSALGQARPVRLSGRDRPAIAVLPFVLDNVASQRLHLLKDGLLRDIVRDLARLRTLFVIAANSLQALSNAALGDLQAGAVLRCDYVCAGTIAVDGPTLRLDIELIAVDGGHVLLSETFAKPLALASTFGQSLASEIAMLVADEVDLAERNLAVRRPLCELDAWHAYHRGLWHLHRFTSIDNAVAENFFKVAIDRDPGFARPYAGLSFTHWSKAYLFDPSRLSEEGRLAHDFAARAVAVDPCDPAAHGALGQALWITGAHDEAVEALERATVLSPSYAFGHFLRAVVEALSGDAKMGIEASDLARALSPFDPHTAANQGTRAVALLRLGRNEEAAAWAARAARHPNADTRVRWVAVLALTAAGRTDEASSLVQRINKENSENGSELFIRTSRMRREDEEMLRDLSRRSGLL
ncbi:winged helix-turn-helix domain-containing protein [Mesorhizobium sp. B4-1-1]|uniref:winged helix-turn-helix domain-containing protein n=1 Tax=Mesorhizobium sp. B4-1-1 TaxID=2589890 RepID=UPI00112BB212|nr:winged helix-turn-helix domain-containing protein [Mesorhizobium sp. B4-1-1]TPI11707.1 hypothetical protein FJW10_28180 [Mesorhizobium sp. B4-1-1]